MFSAAWRISCLGLLPSSSAAAASGAWAGPTSAPPCSPDASNCCCCLAEKGEEVRPTSGGCAASRTCPMSPTGLRAPLFFFWWDKLWSVFCPAVVCGALGAQESRKHLSASAQVGALSPGSLRMMPNCRHLFQQLLVPRKAPNCQGLGHSAQTLFMVTPLLKRCLPQFYYWSHSHLILSFASRSLSFFLLRWHRLKGSHNDGSTLNSQVFSHSSFSM